MRVEKDKNVYQEYTKNKKRKGELAKNGKQLSMIQSEEINDLMLSPQCDKLNHLSFLFHGDLADSNEENDIIGVSSSIEREVHGILITTRDIQNKRRN